MVKINEKNLIKISLITFIFTFTLLTFISLSHAPTTKQISQITLKDINKNIQIQAQIKQQSLIQNNLFLTLKDQSGEIKAIAFKTQKELPQNKNYTITGKITIYKNKPELTINKIEEEIKP